jgi:serine/threonine protein kinase
MISYNRPASIFSYFRKPQKDGQLFARKVMRVSTWLEEDLKNEIKVLELLSETSHPHVVEILGHGRLQAVGKFYVIDMELADLSLAEYIDYLFRNKELPPDITFHDKFGPRVSDASTDRYFVSCSISSHIANGLAFLHEKGQVHRDLKPQNGTSPLTTCLTLVLYCSLNKTWKLTDFGFTSEGISSAKTTLYGRGTSGYRAPELLDFRPGKIQFSNRSDIWALGCIFHEIIHGRRLFENDFETFKYKESSETELTLTYSFGNVFWDSVFSEWAKHLLSKVASARPTAKQAYNVLATYAILFSPILPTAIPNDRAEILDWSHFIGNISMLQSVFDLAQWFSSCGDHDSYRSLLRSLVLRNNSPVYDFIKSKAMSKEDVFWHKNAQAVRQIGIEFFEEGHRQKAVVIYEMLRTNAPEGIVQPILSSAFHAQDDYSFRALVELGDDIDEGLWEIMPFQCSEKSAQEVNQRFLRHILNRHFDEENFALYHSRASGNLSDLEIPKLVVFGTLDHTLLPPLSAGI